MAEKKSQSEIIREHINNQFDTKYDYSTKQNRSNDVKIIAKNYKGQVIEKYEALKSHHAKILKEVMQKRKLDPRTFGLSKKIPKFTPPDNLDATITPKPQSITQTQPQQTSPGTGAPFSPGQSQMITPEPQFIKFEPKGVAATWNALYLGAKSIFSPYATDLTEEEKLSLGEMWTPIFNKYLSEKMEIVVCFIATAGVFAPHIIEGRKISKQQKNKQSVEDLGHEKKDSKKTSEQKKPTQKDVSASAVPNSATDQDKLKDEEIRNAKNSDIWEE